MQQLREYQQRAIDALRQKYAGGSRRVLMVAPCGAGKTTIAAEVIKRTVAKGGRVLFLAHRRELIRQCSARLDQFGIAHGVALAGGGKNLGQGHPVVVASVQTLARRDKPPASLVIVDESHRAVNRQTSTLVSHYPDAHVLGLTATPRRTDGKGLAEIFDSLLIAAHPSELYAGGYLAVPRVYAPSRPDTSHVKRRMGDFDPKQLTEVMTTAPLVGDIIEHWRRHAEGRRTALFAVSVAHSKHLARAFQDAGIPAAHVDGETPTKQRDKLLEDLRKGLIKVLCNVQVLTEGWDLPSLGCVILARPTQSLTVYLQSSGRVLRPHPGPLPVILDHANCCRTFGLPTVDRRFTVTETSEHTKLGRSRDMPPPPVKVCPVCMAVCPAMARICPGCRSDIGELPEAADGHLEEVVDRSAGLPGGRCPDCAGPVGEIPTEWPHRIKIICMLCGYEGQESRKMPNASRQQKIALWLQLEEIQQARGYKPGWIAHQYRNVTGVWPRGVRRSNV